MLFGVSIALNIVTLSKRSEADFYAWREDLTGKNAVTATPQLPTDAADYKGYFAQLRQQGVSLNDTKPIILSWLEAQLNYITTAAYWQSDMNVQDLESEMALAEQRKQLRGAIFELYGSGAETDPAFDRLFRPLPARFGFLSSSEQIAFQHYQIQRQLKQFARADHASLTVGQKPVEDVLDHRSLVSSLSEFLTGDSLTQLLYRYSPIADLMRSAGVSFTEREFRHAFHELERMESGIADPAEFVEIRDDLRLLLGSDRFTHLWAARDPAFTAMKMAGERNGLSDDAILSSYEIVNDTQDLLAGAAMRLEVDPERAQSEMRGILDIQMEKLIGLVGPEIAERLLHAQSELALQISAASQQSRTVAAP